MSPHNEDEVPDSEDEMPGMPAERSDDSSAIGAFTTPSLGAKGGAFITIPSESISEFTTPNRSDPGNHGRVPVDISNFTTTISSDRHPASSAIDTKSSTSMLPRTLLSPASLPSNTAQPFSSPPRPKPRYKPLPTDKSASIPSPAKATPHSLPLSPPSTELRRRTHAKTSSSTLAPVLQPAASSSSNLNKNPDLPRPPSAHKAPPLIDISSSEDERPKPSSKRKLQFITDDEHEPIDLLDHILSPETVKVKLKKPKRIETDDEFDADEGDDGRCDVKLDIRVSKGPNHRSKKASRPAVLSDREDVDELDLIGASGLSKSNGERAPTKLRKPRTSKSKKGETDFKSREFIEDSDREAYGTLPGLPCENAVHSRHAKAEVVVPLVAPPIINAPPVSRPPSPDATTPSNVPTSQSPSALRPQELGLSLTETPHTLSKSKKRKPPEIQDRCIHDYKSPGTSPAAAPAKKKRRKNVVASNEGELKLQKPSKSKSKSKTSKSVEREKSDKQILQEPVVDDALAVKAGFSLEPRPSPSAQSSPSSASRKRIKSSSKSKRGKVILSEDEEGATSTAQRRADEAAYANTGDIVTGDPSIGNRATSETKDEVTDIPEEVRANDGHDSESETKPGKTKKLGSKESTAAQARISDVSPPMPTPMTPTFAPCVERIHASNVRRANSDAPAPAKPATSTRRKSEPLCPTQFDKSREAATISEILQKTGLSMHSSVLKPRQGLSRTHRIAPLHSRIRTPPPRQPPIPKAKKGKKVSEDEYDSEEEYELEGLTEKEKKKRREEKRNRLLYSP